MIGGGFIGLEVAASAAERGCTVTVVEAAPRLMARGVPEDLAALLAERHRRAGIELRLATSIRDVERVQGTVSIVLADGTRLDADAIVAGIGAVPETALAAAAGLAIDNGIAVDEYLATSDPDIFAAGDCCSFPPSAVRWQTHPAGGLAQRAGSGDIRCPGHAGESQPYATVPWFWSDQHDLCLQITGLPDEESTVVVRDDGGGASMRFHLDGQGRLVAASGVGPIGKIARDIRLAEMLIERRAHPDPAALASPGVS